MGDELLKDADVTRTAQPSSAQHQRDANRRVGIRSVERLFSENDCRDEAEGAGSIDIAIPALVSIGHDRERKTRKAIRKV